MKYLLFLCLMTYGVVYAEINNKLKESAEIVYTYQPQGIAILVDRDNYDYDYAKRTNFAELGIMSIDLDYTILDNIKIPVLTSKSILTALIQWYLTQKDDTKIQKSFSWLKKSWTIKEVDDLYLMLPTQWAKQLGNKGLKDNLKDVTWEQAQNFVHSERPNTTPFTDVLAKVFVSQQEFKKNKAKEIPSWMIYLVGHGDKEYSIAGLLIDDFKKFTNFLETKIATKILIYNSCYAGGANKILGFQDTYKKQFTKDQNILFQQTFSFPIILLSATEASTSTGAVGFNITSLFEQLEKNTSDLPDYYTILKKAGFLFTYDTAGKRDIMTENMPQIRLPRTEWFSTTSLNSIKNNVDYIIISKVQAQTREKPLTIPETVKTIFIYSPVVPFNITISQSMTQRIPRIIFMDVTDAHFAEINAPNLTFEGLCRLFKPLDAVISHKIYIDSLTFADESKKITLKNCYFYLGESFDSPDQYWLMLQGSDAATLKWATYKAIVQKNALLETQAPITISAPLIKSEPYPNYSAPGDLQFQTTGKKLQATLKPAK